MNAIKFVSIFLLSILLFGCQADASLQAIYNDDELIALIDDDYTSSVYLDNSDQMANEMILEFRGFSGRETLFELTLKAEATLTLTCKSQLEIGNYKIVLVNESSEVTLLFVGEIDTTETLTLPAGTYLIKQVGSQAFGELDLMIDNVDNLTITKK